MPGFTGNSRIKRQDGQPLPSNLSSFGAGGPGGEPIGRAAKRALMSRFMPTPKMPNSTAYGKALAFGGAPSMVHSWSWSMPMRELC